MRLTRCARRLLCDTKYTGCAVHGVAADPLLPAVAMGTWRRRIRGAIGMGLNWGAAWFGAGLLLLAVVGFGAADVPFPVGFGLLGFLAGVTFSLVFATAERRRRLEQLSLARFAGWGALGGLVFSGLFVIASGLWAEFPVVGMVFALAGAGSAAGTLALARRAGGRELRDGGD